jgi:hypothetical protein
MKKQPFSYINLPIYSVSQHRTQIATYQNKIIFSGGGGHGISNQIIIFEASNMNEKINQFETDNDIIENLVVNMKLNILACTSNQDVLIYKIDKEGTDLRKLWRFRADTTLKNPTLVSKL